MSSQHLLLEKTDLVRAQVNVAYSAAATTPEQKHPFPVGRRLAENLGYPTDVLEEMPESSMEAFAGVSKVSLFADLPRGATVLDLGCGAGLDSIIAAYRVGRTGRVIGVDFSKAMLARARAAKELANLPQLEFQHCDAEQLPLANGSVDIALANGIFNLNPRRREIFSELARVLRPGGRAYVAELILAKPLPDDRTNERDWLG